MVHVTGAPQKVTPVLDAWRAETGGRYRLLDEDVSDWSHEADLVIADSLAELWAIAEADELRPIFSDTVNARIPASLRDPESRWIGLAARARIVFYNVDLVSEVELRELRDYAALGDERWQNRLCVSSSRVAGNQSLVAALIRRHGLREAEIIVRKWRANLVVIPFTDDVDLIRAVADGQCAIGIADSHRLLNYSAAAVDAPIAPHFFERAGSMLSDVSGAGVSRHAKDPDGARQLLEWLTGDGANALFAVQTREFPANPDAKADSAVAAWIEHLQSAEAVADLGFLLEDATKLIERARYD